MPFGSHDHLMMRNVQPVSKKITDCIPIKYIKKKEKPFMPTNRKINLKDPKFRSKGLLKKNINNKYGKPTKRKKEDLGIRKKRKPRKSKKRGFIKDRCAPKQSNEKLDFSCYTKRFTQ